MKYRALCKAVHSIQKKKSSYKNKLSVITRAQKIQMITTIDEQETTRIVLILYF